MVNALSLVSFQLSQVALVVIFELVIYGAGD